MPASIPAPVLVARGPSPTQDASSAATSHPLPAGMRDFLPPDARRLGDLARQLLGSFELYGYELVTLPVFEYESVLASDSDSGGTGTITGGVLFVAKTKSSKMK